MARPIDKDDIWRIVIAAGEPRLRTRLREKLTDALVSAELLEVSDQPSLLECLQSVPLASLILHESALQDGESLGDLTDKVHRLNPSLHVLWLLKRGASDPYWLEKAESARAEIAIQPIQGLEIAQSCRRARRAGIEGAPTRMERVMPDSFAGERLFESDERYRFLFNGCSDGIMVFRLAREGDDHSLIEVNRHLCQMLGYPRAEALELKPRDIFEPTRMKHVEARVKSLKTYRHLFFESVLVARDGQRLPVGLTARLFSIGQEPYIVMLAQFRGNSDVISSGGQIMTQPSYTSQTGEIIYEYWPETGSIQVDGAVFPMTGYSKEDLERRSRTGLIQIIHEDDRQVVLGERTRAIRKLGTYQFRYRIRHADGHVSHLEDTGIAIPGKSGRAERLLGTIHDITEQVASELEHQRAEQALQHSKRLESLGVLAGGIAHDFNNILAAIIGLTDMSIQALDKADPEVLEDLGEALGAAHRAKDLVKQILAFSRQSGEEHEPIHLHTVVGEVLGLLRASLPANIQIVDRVNRECGMVLANATQMHQVVMNYCTNGLQAMSDKGGVLEVRLENFDVTRRFANTNPKLRPGPYLKLTVSDRGHGMAPHVMRRIFDPFYTTKGPGEGVGMGLAMVYGIVADHGGAVVVDTAIGRGTEFTTYIPRVDSFVTNERRTRRQTSRGTERILVVDDEPMVRRFCERALGQLGYAVRTEESANDAINLLKSEPSSFDLIITDYQMPDVDGIRLATRIRRLGIDVPILLFTGFSSQLDEDVAKRAGVAEIISKPIVVSQLADTIRQLLTNNPSNSI